MKEEVNMKLNFREWSSLKEMRHRYRHWQELRDTYRRGLEGSPCHVRVSERPVTGVWTVSLRSLFTLSRHPPRRQDEETFGDWIFQKLRLINFFYTYSNISIYGSADFPYTVHLPEGVPRKGGHHRCPSSEDRFVRPNKYTRSLSVSSSIT